MSIMRSWPPRHGQPAAHRGQAGTPTRTRPRPAAAPQASITKTSDEQSTYWKITLPHVEAAKFDAALQSHHDALIADWKRDHDDTATVRESAAVAEHH